MPLPPLEHPWIDASRAPLYVLRFPNDATDVELQNLIVARERWAEATTGKVAWIVDMSNIGEVTPRQRKVFGEHLQRMKPFNTAHNIASALIAPSALLRGFLTAVFWISPPTFPNRVFSRFADADAWALKRMAEEGISLGA